MAAIAWSTGMAPDAGRTLFTVARVAGWVAHYLEELGERPLRFRARAVYAAPAVPAGRGVTGGAAVDRTYAPSMASPPPTPTAPAW